jgi:mannan endo-1,4-beta-mannosidase
VRSLVLLWLITAPASAQSFVTVDGTHFVSEGRAFHVIGANVAVMHGDAQRSAYRETLAAAAADHLNVVRVWALGEYPSGSSARSAAFRIGPDGWVEESYAQLDRVLAEARRSNLRVVIVLANRWGDHGGVPQYLQWAGHLSPGRHPTSLAMSAFWACESCEARYREHVRRIVTRVNAETGVRYADDPTIFAWELINEAEAAGVVGEDGMLGWIDRQAAFVRELDGNHLVSAGHLGYASLRDRSLWARVCSLPGISYCDSHAYPLREGRLRSARSLSRWIDDRAHVAHDVAHKPLLFGEIGVPNGRGVLYGRERARWLGIFLDRVIANGAGGAMVWTYLPSTVPPRTYAVYAHGDRARETLGLRRVLATTADRARDRAPIVRPAIDGEIVLFDPSVRVRGPATLHRAFDRTDEGARVRVDPLAFERARFEGVGTWAGSPGVPHFYGGGLGEVTYLVRTPPGAGSIVRVRMRASSELPGAGQGVSEADTSELRVSIDGVALGAVTAPADDGLGAWVEVAGTISRRAVHRIEIAAIGGNAGGLCLYGRTETGDPAGVEIIFE